MSFRVPIVQSVDPYGFKDRCALVRCQNCKAIVSPFFALKHLVRGWDTQAAAVRSLSRTRDALEREVEDLKRQRKNLRAQARRAKR